MLRWSSEVTRFLTVLGDGTARRFSLSEWRVGLGGAGAAKGLWAEFGRAKQQRADGRARS